MVEVLRVELDRKTLALMPRNERGLFFTLGHVVNELSIFNKLLYASIQSVNFAEKGPERLVYSGQGTIILRDFIGKLAEAWKMYQKRVLQDKAFNSSYRSHFSDTATKAEKELSRLMNDGMLTRVRNSFSFHYDDRENLIEEIFQKLPDENVYFSILSNKLGNSFFHISEILVLGAMLLKVDARSPSETAEQWTLRTFGILQDMAMKCSSNSLILYMEVMAAISNRYFDNPPNFKGNVQHVALESTRMHFFVKTK